MPIPFARLSTFYFCYFALLGALLPFWSLYLDDIGLTALQIGTLASMMMVTKIIAPTLWGWLADRSGKRLKVIRLGSLVAMICFAGIFISNKFYWILLVVAAYTFFWNAVLPQFEVLTLDSLRNEHHRYGQVRLWGSLGFVFVVLSGGILFDHISIAYLPVFMFVTLGLIFGSSLLVSEPRHVEHHVGTEQGLLSTLIHPVVLAFLVSSFLLQVSHGPYYAFFSLYMEKFGYSRSLIGQLWALGVAAEVVMFMVLHRLLPVLGIRRVMLISLALAILRWYLVARFGQTLSILLFAQLLHAATYASFHAAAVALIHNNFSRQHQGRGQALYSGLCYGGGGAVGAYASGWMWEWSPQWCFLGASVAALAAYAIAFLWVRGETLHLPSVEAELGIVVQERSL